jgi:predicted nucleic acid-binding protein
MKAVLDTNVLIDFFRNPNCREAFEAKTLRPQFFMSSVVSMELFAGCRTKRQQSELASFLKPFEKAKRVITPDHSCFLEAGRVLVRLGGQGVDIVRRRQMVNDILIAVTAARVGAVVITANIQDFALSKRILKCVGCCQSRLPYPGVWRAAQAACSRVARPLSRPHRRRSR